LYTPEARSSSQLRTILLILGALNALAPLSTDFYLPALPTLTADLGANTSTGQLTLTACLVGIAISQVVAGSLSDSLGRRRLVIWGLGGYAAISALCALAPDIAVLLLLRLGQGAACGAALVVSRALVRDAFAGDAAARVFSSMLLVSGVAPVLGPVVGAQMLLLTSWRGIFAALALIGVLLLAAVAARLPETLPVDRRHEPGLRKRLGVFRRLLGDQRFVPYAISASLTFAVLFAYIAGSPFVLEDVYGLSPQLYGVAFGVNAATIVVSSQVGRRLVGRYGSPRLLWVGAQAMAFGGVGLLLTVILGLGLAPLICCLLTTVGSIGLILPNATALALADQGHAAGSASALYGFGQFGIGAIAAPLVGIAGSGTAVPMAVVISGAGVGSLLVLWRVGCAKPYFAVNNI
jgi:MFS transporter, DHA1 family, multidrug resistance protein